MSFLFFFFQAEDGIRDVAVTGVQTCALPISEEHFETALKYYPDFEEAQVGLGRVLIALGKPDLALAHLRRAISLNPKDEVCLYQLFEAHKALGNVLEQQRALAEFQRLQSQKERQEKSMITEAFSP